MRRAAFLVPVLILAMGGVAAASQGRPASRTGPELINPALWSSVYTPGETARGVAVSPDGNVAYVVGCSGDSGGCFGSDILTVAYGAETGVVLWDATYDGPAHLEDDGFAVAVSPDGARVFVTGDSSAEAPNYDDFATVAYDASTGTQLWAATYDRAQGSDAACCIAVTPDGNSVLVTGDGEAADDNTDFVTIRYDAATGSQLWTHTYDGPQHGEDTPAALVVSPNGEIAYLTGPSAGVDRNDWATVAIDVASGGTMWSARFDYPPKPGDTPSGLVVSPDGSRVFVTGCVGHIDECTNGDYVTIAYDGATGAREWIARYDGPAHNFDVPAAIGVNPDGSLVYVTGESKQGSSLDYATIAYDAATGQQVWIATFDGPGGHLDAPCCLAVSVDGSTVVVSGITVPEYQRQAYETVAYDAHTGTERWSSFFLTRPRYNVPSAVRISGQEAIVFVAGSTTGPSHAYDWGVVAYELVP